MDERILEQLENVPYQKDEDETALETIKHLLEDKDKGIFVFEAFKLCHILYFLLIIAS